MKASNTFLSGVVLAAALSTAACKPPPEKRRGEALFETCAACHGDRGQGNQEAKAPALAGMPQWYLERQLTKFQDHVRADNYQDTEGLRMRPMSYSLEREGDVEAVSAYIAELPPVHPAPTLDGDAEKGQSLYGTCASCHGPDAKGNKALNGPPLAITNDWYLLTQLKKFKAGVRGANPKDTTGQQMAPMAGTLADERAMKNVIAYIQSLSSKK